VLLEIFLSYAVNILLIDRPVLQVEEPEVDCMVLIMSTLPSVFWFLWK